MVSPPLPEKTLTKNVFKRKTYTKICLFQGWEMSYNGFLGEGEGDLKIEKQ
jgi:hypothetical protein